MHLLGKGDHMYKMLLVFIIRNKIQHNFHLTDMLILIFGYSGKYMLLTHFLKIDLLTQSR